MKSSKIEVVSNVNLQPGKGNIKNRVGSRMAGFAKKYFNSLQIFVIVFGFLVLIYLFIASFSVVDGPSMQPNFQTGDLTIYEKLTTTWGKLEHGDVIVFQAPDGKDFIKRVIGLPGDTVKVEGGKVYVNGIVINEPYLSDENKYVRAGQYFTEGREVTATESQYIAFGDNRSVSYDSRSIGPIDKKDIKGKVWIRFWPIEKFGAVNHVRYPELEKK